jgi:hypothetical protein
MQKLHFLVKNSLKIVQVLIHFLDFSLLEPDQLFKKFFEQQPWLLQFFLVLERVVKK